MLAGVCVCSNASGCYWLGFLLLALCCIDGFWFGSRVEFLEYVAGVSCA